MSVSPVAKLLMLISFLFSQSKITSHEKVGLKNRLLNGDQIITAALECYEEDNNMEELLDTLHKLVQQFPTQKVKNQAVTMSKRKKEQEAGKEEEFEEEEEELEEEEEQDEEEEQERRRGRGRGGRRRSRRRRKKKKRKKRKKKKRKKQRK